MPNDKSQMGSYVILNATFIALDVLCSQDTRTVNIYRGPSRGHTLFSIQFFGNPSFYLRIDLLLLYNPNKKKPK